MDRIYAALRAPTCSSRSAPRARSIRPRASSSTRASAGARTLELNLERSQGSAWFDETRLGPASELVPAWVEEMLA